LKVARDYEQICRILEAAFSTNDFDGLDVKIKLFPGEHFSLGVADASAPSRRGETSFHWSRHAGSKSLAELAEWTLSLELVSGSNRHRGSLMVHRVYSQRGLQFDINLLTAAFPGALADALDRVLQPAVQIVPRPEQEGLVTARAG
jgi:hypothetical protein